VTSTIAIHRAIMSQIGLGHCGLLIAEFFRPNILFMAESVAPKNCDGYGGKQIQAGLARRQ